MVNFWQNFKKPTRHSSGQAIYALAPMAGITDSAFRQICKRFGADIVYSEMASVEALVHNPKKTLQMLEFSESERPYVVQLFGAKPEHFYKAVKIIEKKIRPDGLDINFGCPVKKVQKQGAGGVLMDNLKLAREIIKITISSTKLPLSIKTRSQVGKTDVLKFLDYIKDLDVKCVMIHGRTLTQAHSGPVNYRIIKQAREYFKGIILANGGVGYTLTPDPSPAHSSQEGGVLDYANWLLDKTGADGIGIAQGALGRPWIFKDLRMSNVECRMKNTETKSKKEIFKVMLNHAELINKLKGRQGIIEMRKHLCWYVTGLPNAKKLREKLVKVETISDIEKLLK